MKIKEHIPNILTLGNLFMGCWGIVQAFHGNVEYAAYAIWIAAIFDFFDGFVARLLKVTSPIGKQLDSLADMVSFGVLPSIIVFQLTESMGQFQYMAFMIAIFSALRLARFNIDTRQSHGFIGVPTPALAFMVSGLPFSVEALGWLSPTMVLLIAIVMSFLLVSPIKMLALKFENYSFRDNLLKYLLISGALILIVALKTIALPLIILYYIFLSLIGLMMNKQ